MCHCLGTFFGVSFSMQEETRDVIIAKRWRKKTMFHELARANLPKIIKSKIFYVRNIKTRIKCIVFIALHAKKSKRKF